MFGDANASYEQEAGTTETNIGKEVNTDGDGQNLIPISKTIQALPLHINVTEIVPADIAAQVRSIPVYTDTDIEALCVV